MAGRGARTAAVALAVSLALLAGQGVAALGRDTAPTGSTPGTPCRPGDNPEPAQQGRVPSEVFDAGWDEPFTCNAELVASHNSTGGFKVLRYVDESGNECAYYDSTLVFPLDAPQQLSEGLGVVVLDMADPTQPRQATTLTSPAMLSPHESLVLNAERGLLAAVLGNPTTYPGVVDVYDVSQDCRAPQLLSSSPVGFLGHESGFAPDGMTLYAASLFTDTVAAIDVADPRAPRLLWVGNHNSHGITVSDDGTRAYLTPFRTLDDLGPLDGVDGDFDGGLTILDTTSIQERDPLPRPEVVAQLSWPDVSIPQSAIPVTIDGTDHLVEIDEFTDGFDPANLLTGEVGEPGAGRIIDISDETDPRVVSNIRLAVHDPEVRATGGILDDPGASSISQGYAGHYCAVPSSVDPGIVACSMILSGLRVFDITDPLAPREVAYVNVPGVPGTPPFNREGAAYAMSAPAFALERNEVWYSDSASGFHVVRLADDVLVDGRPVQPEDGARGDAARADGAPDAAPDRGDRGRQSPAPAVAPAAPLPATGPVFPALVGLVAFGSSLALTRRR